MNKTNIYRVIALTICILTSVYTYASELQASVSKKTVTENEVFSLSIIADTELDSDSIDFSVLNKDFIVGPPNYSLSQRNINGITSIQTEWTLAIASKQIGKLTIPAFSVGTMNSRPIIITVTDKEPTLNITHLFEFTSDISTNVLYPKQTAVLTTRLVIKANPRQLNGVEIVRPSSQGLLIEPFGQMAKDVRVLNGRRITYLTQKYKVQGENSSEYIIKGPTLRAHYLTRDVNSGATRIQPLTISAKDINLTIKQLPKDFKGNWLPASALEMTQNWQDEQGNPLSATAVNTVKQGTSITRTIRIRARGTQAEYLPRIGIVYPSTLRVYPEQPQFDTSRDGTVTMTVKQVLIPTEAGEITLPGYSLNWWDSNRDQARKADISALKLNVEKSDSGLITLPESALPAQPAIKPAPVVQGGVDSIWKTLTFVFGLLWLVSSAIAFGLWKQRGSTKAEKVETSTHSSSLQDLENIIKQGDSVKIERAVNDYLNTHHLSNDSEAVRAVKEELNVMNHSRFSSIQREWRPNSLITKVKQLAKEKKSKPSHQLEKL